MKQAYTNAERKNKISKNSIIQLIVAIIAFGLFLVVFSSYKFLVVFIICSRPERLSHFSC